MRRIFLLAFAASVLVLGAPAVASAHHGKSRHHARRHHHRVIVFGARSGASSAVPQTSPTQPTTPSPDETAGTVKEFTGGVLTIMLADGKTLVSGKVTEKTEIQCQAAANEQDNDADEQGEDSGTDNSGPVAHSSDNGGGDDEHAGQVNGNCTTEALKPGTVVREAELSIGSGGTVWDQIDLIL